MDHLSSIGFEDHLVFVDLGQSVDSQLEAGALFLKSEIVCSQNCEEIVPHLSLFCTSSAVKLSAPLKYFLRSGKLVKKLNENPQWVFYVSGNFV